MFKIFLFSIITVATVNAQLKVPALSPSSKTTQTVGLTEIEIEYSRPSKRNRIIFGENGIIPFGELWRTGANAATKISFSDDLTISGIALKKGSYTILTKPNESNWQVYLYTYKSGNWTNYVNQKPIVSFTTKTIEKKEVSESFLIYIDTITLDSAELVFSWGTIKIILPLKFNTHEKTMSNIEKVLSGPSNFDYFQAALYLHETQKDLNTALSYIQKVTKAENPLFFQVYRESLILADMDRKPEAIEVAQKSLELSKKAGNKDLIRLNERNIKKWSK
ncbi:DUF2911 domain-containing protein [Aquimarina sp. AD1]|uniref:DUF2911 domain-containing protein n=1 Tax=Aquimarina sp. (strain AD1) TaxID=1714848 RepID=UPI000E53B6DE|nr:DUF2911 domain-containing protein [Aquimarina sp. AD1]AXT57570.1 DUF2911 domain-containing protein [Aquimarina sp. AD1]RKN35123.1 DUF2911 domain-containing protein [Aquimarina sp. AD1]